MRSQASVIVLSAVAKSLFNEAITRQRRDLLITQRSLFSVEQIGRDAVRVIRIQQLLLLGPDLGKRSMGSCQLCSADARELLKVVTEIALELDSLVTHDADRGVVLLDFALDICQPVIRLVVPPREVISEAAKCA